MTKFVYATHFWECILLYGRNIFILFCVHRNYVTLGTLKTACRRPNFSRTQPKTNGAVINFPSKALLFGSFQMFHAVYMSRAATCLRCSWGISCKEDIHHASISTPLSGVFTTPLDQPCIRNQTSCANTQWRQRWAAVSGSWSQKGQFGSHGQAPLISLSAVRILDWIKSQAKNLCFPSQPISNLTNLIPHP